MLTRHSFVFQIIPWNWKHLTNHKVQGKKVFWHVILHSYLCNTLCKFFIKIEGKCFSKTFSEIEGTWPINSRKEEIVLSSDSKELFVQRFVKVFDQNWNTWRREIKEQHPRWLYCTVIGLSEVATRGVAFKSLTRRRLKHWQK